MERSASKADDPANGEAKIIARSFLHASPRPYLFRVPPHEFGGKTHYNRVFPLLADTRAIPDARATTMTSSNEKQSLLSPNVANSNSGETHIRSFVHRRAHITPSQEQALARLLPLWSISYRDNILKPETVFGNDNPLILEIGFGMGETTQKIAQARPDDNFLGVEVFNAGVGALLKRIDDNQISNIRIIQHDAVEVVRDMIAPGSLAGIHIYFPDPWPKKRHHKRRLVQSPFIQLLTSRLKPGGYIHCATDWENYAEQMLEVLSAEPMLSNTHEGYAPRPDFRPLTKFENRGLRLGHGVWDLIFTRNDTPTPELNWPKKVQ